MNAFSRISCWQKMIKGATLTIILLQTACGMQFQTISRNTREGNLPSPPKPAAGDAGATWICRDDILQKDSKRPEAQPFAQTGARQGAQVVLKLRHQQELAGRLLSVRDHALVISQNEVRNDRDEGQLAGIVVVRNQDIRYVIIKGESKVLKGTAIGFLVGAGLGVTLGLLTGDDQPCDYGSACPSMSAETKAVLGGVVLGVAGLIVGRNEGAAASKADEVSYPQASHDFSALRLMAQFPNKEPEYLSAISE
ncbi:MAG: hypothetical protein ACREOO_10255 [bacterium]